VAKDLPYFKFFCSEWNDGDITLESFKIQGLFINVCSYYWSNECILTSKTLKKKFKSNIKDINYLIKEGLIKENENKNVSITFLDEQINNRGKLSNQNSINAKKRWDKKKEESESNASALNSHSEKDAIKRREDNIREDNIREEILNSQTWLEGILRKRKISIDDGIFHL